jgi:hypothetical protein
MPGFFYIQETVVGSLLLICHYLNCAVIRRNNGGDDSDDIDDLAKDIGLMKKLKTGKISKEQFGNRSMANSASSALEKPFSLKGDGVVYEIDNSAGALPCKGIS